MTALKIFFRCIEYSPLGFIPGAVRIIAAKKEDGVIKEIANRCLFSSKGVSETTRGSFSCCFIGVNTLVLPLLDLIQLCKPSTAQEKKVKAAKIADKKIEELQKANDAFDVLDRFYQANDREELSKLEEKELRKALRDIHHHTTAHFSYPGGGFYALKYWLYDQQYQPDAFIESYNEQTFLSCVTIFAMVFSDKKSDALIKLMNCSEHCLSVCLASYMKEYYKTFQEEIQTKIQELEASKNA